MATEQDSPPFPHLNSHIVEEGPEPLQDVEEALAIRRGRVVVVEEIDPRELRKCSLIGVALEALCGSQRPIV